MTPTKFILKPDTSAVIVKQLLEKLFEIRDTAHKYHLLQKSKSIATHLALETLYSKMLKRADSISELYFGLYGTMELNWQTVTSSDPLTYIEQSYQFIDKNRGVIKESFLQNEIDTVQALLVRTMYRLKFVTAQGA